MKTYIERIQDRKIKELLKIFGGVVIQGAKATGKSTSGQHLAKSDIRLDADPNVAALADADPSFVLQGKTPRLIDEWQAAPSVWNAVRHEIDDRQIPGQFILTGSATPRDDITRHSGAGRFARIELRTLSLAETGLSSKQVDFSTLFQSDRKKAIAGYGGPDVRQYASALAAGGWPSMCGQSERNALIFGRAYLDDISRVSIPGVNGSADPVRMTALIRALSRNLSTECSITKLAREAQLGDGALSDKTARKYLDLLERIFVLEELPPWNVAIRSNVRRRVSPKWHFVDPSIAVASLGLSGERLLSDLETFGLYFESLAIRDLRVYASFLDASVFQYRDETGLEVDAIVENRQGEWSAFEIKLGGGTLIQQGIASLLALKAKVSDARQTALKSLNVITAGKVSHTDKDSGVNIIALGHLFV